MTCCVCEVRIRAYGCGGVWLEGRALCWLHQRNSGTGGQALAFLLGLACPRWALAPARSVCERGSWTHLVPFVCNSHHTTLNNTQEHHGGCRGCAGFSTLSPGRLGPSAVCFCSNSKPYLQGARKLRSRSFEFGLMCDHFLTPRTAPRSINACKLLCDRAMMEDEVARFGTLAGRSGPLQLLLLTLPHPQAACRAGRCQEAAG